MVRVDYRPERRPVRLLAQVPSVNPGKLRFGHALRSMGHPLQAEICAIRKDGGEQGVFVLDLLAGAHELDPRITERVSEWRFRQLAREGAAAPAFLLDEYGLRRRRATLVAHLLDLETRLSDAAVGMFVRLILGLFTKARKGIERRYQATAKEVADLMRMLSSTIEVLTRARDANSDPFEALDSAIGWSRLGRLTKIRLSRHASAT